MLETKHLERSIKRERSKITQTSVKEGKKKGSTHAVWDFLCNNQPGVPRLSTIAQQIFALKASDAAAAKTLSKMNKIVEDYEKLKQKQRKKFKKDFPDEPPYWE